MEEFDEVIKEFLVESYESLDQLDGDLVALEEAPDDRERLGSIFRTVHTIKGTSGFLALPKLERIAHVGENLLVPLRDGDLRLNEDIANGLLGMVDAIRDILGNLESGSGEGDKDYASLVDDLKTLLDSGGTATPADNAGADEAANEATENETDQAPAPRTVSDAEIKVQVKTTVTQPTEPTETAEQVDAPAPTVVQTESKDSVEPPTETAGDTPTETVAPAEAANVGEEPTLKPAEKAVEMPIETPAEKPVATETEGPREPVRETTPVEKAASKPQQAPAPAAPVGEKKPSAASPATRKQPTKSEPKGGGGSEKSRSVADATVRIDVELLDKLMNLVGELVLSRNHILQFCNETEDATMVTASQRLNLITTELQEGVMKTRMQPIRNAWSKLPRVVRDLSTTCGKKVEVRMEGASTELDKTILEAIKDPLTHIVRNSVDHGIETPEVREAKGKAAEGVLILRAYHEGGRVNIEIADDGGGINTDRVRDKAIEKGLISAEQAERMGDRELTNLILLPGFSTAAKVTNVSGRGVGMDVVKTNIERIGGTLDIQSTLGKGTTLRMKIPLTLAIVPALIVNSVGESYAIPQVALLELVRLEADQASREIEFVHDVPVYRLREKLLPLVYLDEQLGLRHRRERGCAQDSVNIVVLQAEDRQFGLVVDSVTDTQEIVVKPLGQHLKAIPTYAGATIMGDGTVALILDVIGLAQKSNVLNEHRDRAIGDEAVHEDLFNGDTEALLIVEAGEGMRAAIRLSTVSRLEEFEASKVERSGQTPVVQYRGAILPLISLNGGFGGASTESGTINTVVYTSGEQQVGIVVGRIVDIVHESRKSEASAETRRIIHDRVTEVVDLEQLVQRQMPYA